MYTHAAIDLTSILDSVCLRNAHKSAISFEGKTWTYSEFDTRCRRLARYLKQHGVRKGDRLGYAGQNHPAFLETLFAAAHLGAIFVPVNYRLSGPELTYIINDAGMHTLIFDGFMQATVENISADLCTQGLLAVDAPASPHPDYEQAIEDNHPLLETVPVSAQDVAFIMYTSGTTGTPKGVMLTHGNIFWNDLNLRLIEDIYGEVVLTCCPMYHIAGLNCAALAAIFRGAHQHIHRMFDPGETLRTIEREKVSALLCVPAMLLFMSQHEEFDTTNLSSVRALLSGGAPVPPALIKRYQQRGLPFYQVYGLTETSPYALMNLACDTKTHPEAAGKPVIFTEVRITDGKGREVPTGEQGEICIRGPNVMSGYWNKPEATTEVLTEDGWFSSGDIGYCDDNGFHYISDRKKDMVISGGENVYPAEVEAVLYQHEAVQEVAILGLPDDKWGEAVTAVLVVKTGTEITLESLRKFCDGKLARYKIPLRLFVVDELPRNPSGKVLKYVLRERLSSPSAQVA
ncbi:long-chain fatty acid--CoA ligase [Spongiibacter sp. KMU-158]|uniref:Long-chain fatty acid--CoA ligase n=1 Tax=Spongiibacter pelagi TaxID=2760804 RepID=A0A927C5W1_9GAMM|nr:long-chain fatty acid--CoA ligase [Spongiibacter pelagi]MBD2860141.1 long-chain fatty acid--CoA ligase [Spongiibacter pelagi]